MIPPMPYKWNGEVMLPLHPKRAAMHLKSGERYTLVPFEDRSSASHRHQFAFVDEAFASLPEHLAERFRSPEGLRKWSLIRAGYSNSHAMACGSQADAERVAAFIRPLDEFSVVTVRGPTVTRYVAMSQSIKAMGAVEFYKSKEAIIEVIARMIDVSPQELKGAQSA